MKLVKSSYKKKTLILLLLSFGMIFANIGFSSLNFPLNFTSINEEEIPNVEIDLDYLEQIPKTSEYQNFNGVGENINISLHQSYLNDSYNTALSPSDPNNNSFSLPCPKYTTFNSTFTNVTIKDIYAPNKTLDIETGNTLIQDISFDWSFSFEVLQSCILRNFSIALSDQTGASGSQIQIRLYNATYNAGEGRIEPDKNTNLISESQDIPDMSGPTWYTYVEEVFLNASKTYGKTFFFRIWRSSGGSTVPQFRYENNAGDTDANNSLTYRNAVTPFVYFEREASLIVKLGLDDNTPKPSEINLKINNTIVSDHSSGNNLGYWTPNQVFSNSSGELSFDITADWWDVTCNVSRVQINYTKTDVPAISSFDISGSGQTVQWNVTRNGGLNYFDSRLSNYQINFTIPNTWNKDTIKVFNGGTPKSSDSTNRSLGNGYREVNVLNAGNGTFWYLTANSTNLLSSIDTFVSGIALSNVNHSSIVDFNATFSEIIRNGDLNLSVYSPSPQYLNHSKILDISILSSSDEFLVSSWDVSLNVSQYGIFKIEISWNNDTAAGFLESDLTIYADTELIPSLPATTFDSSNTFNMTVFFNDTGLNTGITADSFSYLIEGGPIRTDNIHNIGSGYYNITFSCNDTDFDYGLNTIIVNATKQYYNNQSESVLITILGETEATILFPPNDAVVDSGDTFDLTIFYNDTVKDLGIAGATINYSLNGGVSYRFDKINYIGSGEYNITISASDSDFNGYGTKNIIVNSSKQYYYNQSNSITLNLLGETSLSSQKIPDKSYYTAAETFNISVYYNDTIKSLGISGANVDIDVDGTIYNPVISPFDNGDGYYNITIDCSDLIFSNYKTFSIRINVSLVNYYNQSNILDTLIVGNETLNVLAPTSGVVFIDGQSFGIIIEYNDTIKDAGIDGATIQYSLNGSGYKPDNYKVNYIGEGKYNITINVNDPDFTNYGFVDIYIDAYKQFYENRSTTYTFHRQITTQIEPENIIDLGSVMKGLNITYTFNYSDTTGKPISQAIWSPIGAFYGFDAFLNNTGDGNYTMHLDSTNVGVLGSPYTIFFNISSTGNETQIIQMTIDVLIIQTEVIDVSSIPEIARNSGLNQSVRFYFNDTTNNLPVLNVATGNIVVKNYATGTPFSDGEYWLFDPYSNGTYILDITMGTRNSGWYTLEINASRFPNYDYSLFNITFYFRGNYTQLNLISYSDPGGVLTPTGLGYNFTIFEGSDTTIVLNLTDSDYSNSIVLGVANSYTATYINLVSSSNGTLSNLFLFTSPNHVGTLTTSLPALVPGRYLINITLSTINYEDVSFSFNLTVIAKYQTNLTVVYKPPSVNAGDSFRIVVQAEFFNGIGWMPLQNVDIIMTPIFDGVPSSEVQTKSTNSTGQLFFDITIRSDAIAMNITLELPLEYDHLADSMVIFEISVIPPPDGLSFEDLLPFIIIIGAALVAASGSAGVYRGVIVPKKREKQRILNEVKTIFDDAINLEHILVLYKGTGTCIFFKSYGSEQIDPELIGGFLSAVSSFGKEMATQEALNEISYGDKMLLLADGALIRVALVLGKNASLILRRHLKEFIGIFEKTFNDVLPKWRGQLNYFRNAGTIVDDILNTSIILPHQISYDFSKAKDLKNPHSKEVLKIAQSCCEEAEREFFFVATLLKEVADRTNKDTAEIFMGIKELRDKKILIPIEISAIGEQPVSQQEINLINQKVIALPNLTNEEKQKLVNDLAQLGPIEREAYLSSLTKQQEIVTAPIKTTIGDLSVENQKAAKKGIKELLKRAKIAQSKKSYIKAIEIYHGAAMLASNWELTTEFLKIQETIRKTRIEDLKIKKTNLENEAKSAVKAKKYLEAATKYKYASKMASEIFKLGVTEMTKEVKRLTNKANELEKIK